MRKPFLHLTTLIGVLLISGILVSTFACRTKISVSDYHKQMREVLNLCDAGKKFYDKENYQCAEEKLSCAVSKLAEMDLQKGNR